MIFRHNAAPVPGVDGAKALFQQRQRPRPSVSRAIAQPQHRAARSGQDRGGRVEHSRAGQQRGGAQVQRIKRGWTVDGQALQVGRDLYGDRPAWGRQRVPCGGQQGGKNRIRRQWAVHGFAHCGQHRPLPR